MRFLLALLMVLVLPVGVFAQEGEQVQVREPLREPLRERVTVKGRIVNERGEVVEYVQVGVPRLQIGTISTVDGRFEMTTPLDTLQFFHVSGGGLSGDGGGGGCGYCSA